jgi:hypothetical protein
MALGGLYGKAGNVRGGGVQSNMCSCGMRAEIVTTRGCTCSELLLLCRHPGIMTCGKVRTFCMCLFVNICKNEMVIYREKGYVPTLCVGEEQFIERDRSRCTLKGMCDSGVVMVIQMSDNLGRFKGSRDNCSVGGTGLFNINNEN